MRRLDVGDRALFLIKVLCLIGMVVFFVVIASLLVAVGVGSLRDILIPFADMIPSGNWEGVLRHVFNTLSLLGGAAIGAGIVIFAYIFIQAHGERRRREQ